MADIEGASPLEPELVNKLAAIPLTELSEAAQAPQISRESAFYSAARVVGNMHQREQETHSFLTIKDAFWGYKSMLDKNPQLTGRRFDISPDEQVWFKLNTSNGTVVMHHWRKAPLGSGYHNLYETLEPTTAAVKEIKVTDMQSSDDPRILYEDGRDTDLLVHVYDLVTRAGLAKPSRKRFGFF